MASTSQPPTPTLHHLNHSQSLRVLWALEELSPSVSYNLIVYNRVNARAPPSLKSVHPLGKSPVLTIPSTSSSSSSSPSSSTISPNTIAESRLILSHISTYYSNSAWTPSTSAQQFRDEYFSEFANATLSPRLSLLLIFDLLPLQSPTLLWPVMALVSRGARPFFLRELQGPFDLMDEALREHDWFAGDTCGLADFNMSWPVDLASQRGYFDGERWPRVRGWLDRVHQRDAYKRALEKSGGYDLVTFGV